MSRASARYSFGMGAKVGSNGGASDVVMPLENEMTLWRQLNSHVGVDTRKVRCLGVAHS